LFTNHTCKIKIKKLKKARSTEDYKRREKKKKTKERWKEKKIESIKNTPHSLVQGQMLN
jgi:hypothetical protein